MEVGVAVDISPALQVGILEVSVVISLSRKLHIDLGFLAAGMPASERSDRFFDFFLYLEQMPLLPSKISSSHFPSEQ